MTLSTRLAKTLAISAATALHGVAIWGFASDTSIEIEGAAGAGEASIGSSFADLAAGMISPSETAEITPADSQAHEVIRPVEPEPAITPERARSEVVTEPLQPAEQPEAMPAQAALHPAPRLIARETVEASEGDPPASVTRSLRPKTRSAKLEERAEPRRKPRKTEKKQVQPRGNAKVNATAGSETGKLQQKASAGSTGKSNNTSSGNAAASNYPGKIMKKISRVPKPRVGKRGTSVVAFTIGPGGGLSAITLARSSGSSRLDQAALRVVQRAAPFPPPPAGARRSFSIKIKGG